MIKYLIKNKDRAPFQQKLANIKDFAAYIEKKSATTGERYTWSDSITMHAMAGAEGRQIKQITYPCYRNGKAAPELGPKIFNCSSTGDSSKPPIYIHYNGYNHYNAIVSATPPATNTYAATKVNPICKTCTFENKKGVKKCEMCLSVLAVPLIKVKEVQKP